MGATEAAFYPRATRGGRFFSIMSWLLAVIACYGFSHTIPGDIAAPGFPLLLWLHAAAFASWVLLFIVQPVLIATGSLRLHRQLGWSGLALACSMIVLGTVAILMGLWAEKVPPFYPHGLFLVRGFAVLLLFGGLVVASVINRKRGEWHKRLMLYASVIVVVPGLERAMPLFLFGANWPVAVDGVTDAIAFAGPAADLLRYRRIHPAYLWGLGAIVGMQIAVNIIAPSSVAQRLLHALGAH